MVREGEQEQKQTSEEQKQLQSPVADSNGNSLFSPRFKSVAAMAGWDEEAILVAALVVEDTPDRLSKHKKRSDPMFKTPPSGSRRKRRAQRMSPVSNPVLVLDLEEEQNTKQERDEVKVEQKDIILIEEKQTEGNKKRSGEELKKEDSSQASCSKSPLLPCMDKLREELSCAICLEICYEPSTTSCGHSFCKKCLRSAADKCGKKCPKCRQLISNGRSCTVNTVLWNTIQLLFPQEIEARKTADEAAKGVEKEHEIQHTARHRSSRAASSSQTRSSARRRSRPSQDEDAALALRLERENLARLLGREGSVRRWRSSSANGEEDEDVVFALRLQREEFMDAFRESNNDQNTTTATTRRSHLSVARANLRAMASRAINIRTRRQHS